MSGIGRPSSYMALEPGTPVYSSEGSEVGTVAVVLADLEEDIFDGIVLVRGHDDHRFVDADRVERIGERGVVLTISAAGAEELPVPRENPAVMSAQPEDTVADDDLAARLHRAWEALTGRR